MSGTLTSSASTHSLPDEKPDKQHAHSARVDIDPSQVDTAAALVAGADIRVDPAEAARVRRKIDRHLMPLMCFLYMVQYADKSTLANSAVLGIIPSTHIDQNQFNWLGTVFYLAYLLFEYPNNLALQRFPVGKWMSICIFIWSIALMAQAAATSFGGLFACRFILGVCEGAITPGYMIVTSMFYTRQEQTRRVGYWFLMNGVAIILMGFISFGVLHTHTKNFKPWQWLMIIMGILTFLTSIAFWFLFPDSPVNARFLTPEERIIAVSRLKVNQTGVENKTFKRSQMIAALKDPKTWLFFFFAGFSNIMNSLSNQRQLIVKQFGFTALQTTLLGCVDGVVEIIAILIGVNLASVPLLGRAYSGIIIYTVALIGCILVITLPSHNKIGLLFSYWTSIPAIVPFVNGLAWISLVTAGHTKRITTNAIVLVGYAIGNAASPFMWKAKYQPRNRVPWGVIIVGCVVSSVLLLALRALLAAENRKRAAAHVDDAAHDDAYVTQLDADGVRKEKHVDRAFLDLTDKENAEFRYVL